MKKAIKAALLGLLATLTVAACVVFAACGGKEAVKFTDQQIVMSTLPVDYTLTLSNDDDTFEMVATTTAEHEPDGMIAQILQGQKRNGTYTYENNVYTLVFKVTGQPDETVKSTYDEATKTYTIPYSIAGRDTTINLNLKYTAK